MNIELEITHIEFEIEAIERAIAVIEEGGNKDLNVNTKTALAYLKTRVEDKQKVLKALKERNDVGMAKSL
jgi:hypothetical protein